MALGRRGHLGCPYLVFPILFNFPHSVVDCSTRIELTERTGTGWNPSTPRTQTSHSPPPLCCRGTKWSKQDAQGSKSESSSSPASSSLSSLSSSSHPFCRWADREGKCKKRRANGEATEGAQSGDRKAPVHRDSLAVNSSSERESTEGDLSIASELERERALGLAMRRTCARPNSPWPSSLQAFWRAFLPALSWPASSLQAFHPRTRSQTRPRHLGRRPRLLPGLFMLKSVP